MADPVARVTLGRSTVAVSRLGFGSTGLGGLFRASSDAAAVATIDAAWAAGLRHYDTAPQYGSGLAENRVGLALQQVSDGVGAEAADRLVVGENDAFHGCFLRPR